MASKTAVIIFLTLAAPMIKATKSQGDGQKDILQDFLTTLGGLTNVGGGGGAVWTGWGAGGGGGSGESAKECKDPTPMVMEVFGMMCDVENCAENAPICLEAMSPPGNMCQYMEKCVPAIDGTLSPKQHRKMMPVMVKLMTECVMKTSMESMGLEYVEDDYQANGMAFLKASLAKNKKLTFNTKNDILFAVSDGVCILPRDGLKISEKIQFELCLMRTCVKSMAGQ